ncbi:MAG: NAD-dependent epimerase/dehydratase family protein [Deltaproteobacteria bacterium]|nr:NAD-dependent epimerase/dehydratase family protein [Candidatus Zymogenaceae bacterium]
MGSYLVTGAAGFIGSAIARRLVTEGNEVVTIDNLSTGFLENIPEGVSFIQGNCQDPDVIEKLRKKCFDAILHIAGQSSGEISFDNPSYDLATNTESTLRLISYGLETGCTRFIYASSMSVYGTVADTAIDEKHVTYPLSFYGVGKLASEHYMRIYETMGLRPTALRYFNVYGPGQNMSNLRQGMVSIFLAQALETGNVVVKGSPDRYRDFIYIDDVVDVTLSTIANEKAVGEVFNVGTGVKTTVEKLLLLIKDGLGGDIGIEFSSGTPGDQKGIYADITKLKTVLGFTPKTVLKDGLESMIQWASKNNSNI